MGEILGTMGVRRPGMRVVNAEMNAKDRLVWSLLPSLVTPELTNEQQTSFSLIPCIRSRNVIGTNRTYRRDLYLSGGLISITSRILVVDLLTKNVPTEMITGLLVMHAER